SSDMAHDLRTPISNLLVSTQVALHQPRSVEDYERLLASNVEELERLTRMIENMLFLARAENAQVALEIEPIDAADEIDRIREYFEGIAAESNVTLASEARGTLWADPTLLRRAVSNLVANAIHHSPPGSEVSIAARSSETGGEVIVSNVGSGIAPQHQKRIFDRFYRADGARGESSSSSGLGLAIVQSIMGLHRGTVSVESVIGQGAVFRLRFPSEPRLRGGAGA
ncbi:MAG: heavy metal sensor histidine kinase, partial [Casimicrobiaceae bacterium]